jgi:hypothetical protein
MNSSGDMSTSTTSETRPASVKRWLAARVAAVAYSLLDLFEIARLASRSRSNDTGAGGVVGLAPPEPPG